MPLRTPTSVLTRDRVREEDLRRAQEEEKLRELMRDHPSAAKRGRSRR